MASPRPKTPDRNTTDLALPGSERTDAFRRATTAALRAMSGEAETEISFAASATSKQATGIQLPYVSRALTPQEMQRVRGAADAAALRLKHHDNALSPLPQNSDTPETRPLYDTLEQVRCEVFGARHMAGVQANLRQKLALDCHESGYGRMAARDDMPTSVALPLLVREALSGEASPSQAGPALNAWRETLSPDAQRA